VNVLEQAGGVERLQRRVDLGGIELFARGDLEIRADRVGFDAAVALHNNRVRSRAGFRRRGKCRSGSQAKQYSAEEQAGHDKPSSYPHPHVHAQSALIPLVATPSGGLLAVSLSPLCLTSQSAEYFSQLD
jgi:hypothetical protein